MIKTFKHKGLKKFFETGSIKGINADHAEKLQIQLAELDAANVVLDMNVSGYRLHQLKPYVNNIWSIKVNGNWRITFQFIEGHAYIVKYEDYH